MRPGSGAGPAALRVLVVDDSALVREGVKRILTRARGFAVESAIDPIAALDKIARVRPDVILLDLEMPRMDGITFLRKLMAEDPIPVVVCSALAGRGSEAALAALESGAIEVVTKPRLGVADFLQESATLLSDAVRAAAAARLARPMGRAPLPSQHLARPLQAEPALRLTSQRILALGASTGGTEALRTIFEMLPPGCPGAAVVQHMPEGFTRAFATRLDQICRVEVKEAADGDHIVDGRVLVAPGNRHLEVRRSGASYVVSVSDGPLVSRHRPSVDVLFRSVARAAGPNAVGAILTGMGDDGADGLLEMRRAGAATLAQDEASCVVFGMPKQAIERGAVDDVVPLVRLAPALLQRAAAETRGRTR